MIQVSRRSFLLAAALAAAPFPALSDSVDPKDWDGVLDQARGQTVYFNAWGGEPRINAYIAWAGEEVAERYGVEVVQVKLADTAEAVSRVLAEKTAGRTDDGAVDLIWINGENFAAMKKNGLLFGPWAEALPNFPLTDPQNNPGVRQDFTVPVEGHEAPWGKAQLAFFHDTAYVQAPPRSAQALLAWAQGSPGRFTYPQPPDFLGSTFLKQMLIELALDPDALYRPVEESDFEAVTEPLWDYLDQLHPHLWREGRVFPANWGAMRSLLGDGELSIAFSFDPADASASIAGGEWPDTVRSFTLERGTIGNVNFVAIPFNAAHKAGAMVLANFLLSPEAQASKQDPSVWGGLTVLSMDALADQDRARFEALDLGPATLTPEELGPPSLEPHPSWMSALETAWTARYGAR